MKIKLTDTEKQRFCQWVIENIDERIVPNDEGLSIGIVFNLVHAIRGDNELYDYHEEQDNEITFWYLNQ